MSQSHNYQQYVMSYLQQRIQPINQILQSIITKNKRKSDAIIQIGNLIYETLKSPIYDKSLLEHFDINTVANTTYQLTGGYRSKIGNTTTTEIGKILETLKTCEPNTFFILNIIFCFDHNIVKQYIENNTAKLTPYISENLQYHQKVYEFLWEEHNKIIGKSIPSERELKIKEMSLFQQKSLVEEKSEENLFIDIYQEILLFITTNLPTYLGKLAKANSSQEFVKLKQSIISYFLNHFEKKDHYSIEKKILIKLENSLDLFINSFFLNKGTEEQKESLFNTLTDLYKSYDDKSSKITKEEKKHFKKIGKALAAIEALRHIDEYYDIYSKPYISDVEILYTLQSDSSYLCESSQNLLPSATLFNEEEQEEKMTVDGSTENLFSEESFLYIRDLANELKETDTNGLVIKTQENLQRLLVENLDNHINLLLRKTAFNKHNLNYQAIHSKQEYNYTLEAIYNLLQFKETFLNSIEKHYKKSYFENEENAARYLTIKYTNSCPKISELFYSGNLPELCKKINLTEVSYQKIDLDGLDASAVQYLLVENLECTIFQLYKTMECEFSKNYNINLQKESKELNGKMEIDSQEEPTILQNQTPSTLKSALKNAKTSKALDRKVTFATQTK